MKTQTTSGSLGLAAAFIAVLFNNDVSYSNIWNWGAAEFGTTLKLSLFFYMLTLLVSLLVTSVRPKDYSIIEPGIKPLVDTMNDTGLIQTIASCEGHSLPAKPPYIYFKTTVDVAARLEKHLQANLSHPRIRTYWRLEGSFTPEGELAFNLYSPRYHSRLYTLRHTIEFWLFRKQINEELLFLAHLVREVAEDATGVNAMPGAADFDYQAGYTEMRNMAPFI